MQFSKKFAGKWVAVKDEKVIASSGKLKTLMSKVQKRKDMASLQFDAVPNCEYFVGAHGI